MTLARISPLNFKLEDVPINFPSVDGVNALALGAGVAENLTIPAGANVMYLAATADVYVNARAVATVLGDTTDGSASMLIKLNGGPQWFNLTGIADPLVSKTISVICVGAAIVSAAFYTM
jgi:hypothetical protein